MNLNHLLVQTSSRDEQKTFGSGLRKCETVNNSNQSKNRELNNRINKKRLLASRRLRKKSKDNHEIEYNTVDTEYNHNNNYNSNNANNINSNNANNIICSKLNLQTLDKVFMTKMNLYMGRKK